MSSDTFFRKTNIALMDFSLSVLLIFLEDFFKHMAIGIDSLSLLQKKRFFLTEF
jgi:hypothetical protein